MNHCPICHKRIWFWHDVLFSDLDNKTEYHTRCVLWDNRRGVKETIHITHCHTRLKDGTMCEGIPINIMFTLPLCEKCFDESIHRFDDINPIIQDQLKDTGDKISK